MNRLISVIVLCLLMIVAGCSTSSTRNGLRVQSLGVEEGVRKYYGDYVEIVAFAPGSGWITMRTRDGLRPLNSLYGVGVRETRDAIGPVISLNNASREDIEKFNRFSQGIGSPIRVKLIGDVLGVVLEEEEIDYLVAKHNESEAALRLVSEQIHWRPEDQVRLAIQRDKEGRILLAVPESPTQFAVK